MHNIILILTAFKSSYTLIFVVSFIDIMFEHFHNLHNYVQSHGQPFPITFPGYYYDTIADKLILVNVHQLCHMLDSLP